MSDPETPESSSRATGRNPSRVGEMADSLSETGRTIIYAVLIALVIRMFAFEPFNIPSSSMVPGLLIGDYLFVSKYSYGYSSLSSAMGFVPLHGRVLFSEPKRGDVVVFKLPRDTSVDYIKRLVGLPGDKIQMRHGLLYINGTPANRFKIEEPIEQNYVTPPTEAVDYIESFPEGSQHIIRKIGDDNMLDDTDIFTVPEGMYFMMGDNRDNSQDSRTPNVSFVPRDNLVGRAEMLFFSLDDTVHLNDFWKLPSAVRWDRIFKKIN